MLIGTDALSNLGVIVVITFGMVTVGTWLDAQLAQSRKWQWLVAKRKDGAFIEAAEGEWLRFFAEQNLWEAFILWVGVVIGWLML